MRAAFIDMQGYTEYFSQQSGDRGSIDVFVAL
jgi:hypothetical protein